MFAYCKNYTDYIFEHSYIIYIHMYLFLLENECLQFV